MKFYTNVYQRGDKIYVCGYENGKRVEFVKKYQPYLFMPKENGFYRTLEGTTVDKMQFDSISEARQFVETYQEVSNFKFYVMSFRFKI